MPSVLNAAPTASTTTPEYHLHPQYREHTPLEPELQKRDAAFDRFPLEKEHDRIAAVLAQWSNLLCDLPRRADVIATFFTPNFKGAELRATETRKVRSGSLLEVEKLQFASAPTLDAAAFRLEFEQSFAGLSRPAGDAH